MRDEDDRAAGASGTVVHRAQGAFGELLVIDDGRHRHLRFGGVGGVDQTVVDRRRPSDLPTVYLRVATIGAVLAERLDRVLLIGLGGGSYARFLKAKFPKASIDVVEIDPIVVQIARDHFDFRERRGLRVFTEDAGEFVADAAADDDWRYDLVFLDAYHGQKIPPALARQSFFRNVAALLGEAGVAVANIGLPERWAEDRVLRRFASAFPGGCFELPVPEEDNRIAVASTPRLPAARQVAVKARAFDTGTLFPFDLLPLVGKPRKWP